MCQWREFQKVGDLEQLMLPSYEKQKICFFFFQDNIYDDQRERLSGPFLFFLIINKLIKSCFHSLTSCSSKIRVGERSSC